MGEPVGKVVGEPVGKLVGEPVGWLVSAVRRNIVVEHMLQVNGSCRTVAVVTAPPAF